MAAEEFKKPSKPVQMVGTDNIINQNLFDPERGAGRVRETEASSVAVQRIRSMVLLGTAILGKTRYAILQDPSDARPASARVPAKQPEQLRLKLGDNYEGFNLSEIGEKRVVFTRGPTKVEVSLDFFRKVDGGQDGKAPAPPPARAVPTPPRRRNLPAAPEAR